jgi:AraC-like DNA-binding protein
MPRAINRCAAPCSSPPTAIAAPEPRHLQLANPRHCPSTWQHLLQLCEAELLQRTRVRSLGERITHLLGPLLNGGREPDLEEVALHLQLPTWTLRRKLAEEGTRFRDLLNETRRDLAETYIRDTELALARLPICWGLLRPRPSSARSSAGRALRRGVPPQPAAGGLKLGGVVGRFRGVQFVSLGFE